MWPPPRSTTAEARRSRGPDGLGTARLTPPARPARAVSDRMRTAATAAAAVGPAAAAGTALSVAAASPFAFAAPALLAGVRLQELDEARM